MTREWRKDRYTDTYRKAGAGGLCSLRQKQYLLQEKPEPHGVYCYSVRRGSLVSVGAYVRSSPRLHLSRRGAAVLSLHTPVCVGEHLYLHTLLSCSHSDQREVLPSPEPHPCGGSVAVPVGSRHSHGHVTNTHSGPHLLLPIFPRLPQLALRDVL